jgi:copper resistance protein D
VTVDPLVVLQIVVAAAQDMLLAAAVGMLACSAMLGRQQQGCPAASTALGRSRFAALGVLVLACGLYLWLQAAVMGGTPFSEAGPIVSAVLTQSHFGVAWSVGFVGAVFACLGGTRHSRTSWGLAAAGMVVYVAGKAASSHAADAGDFTLREAVHVLHLGATAVWAGSVIVAAPVLWRWNAAASEDISGEARSRSANVVAFCARLSHLATIALAVVIVTGIYNATQDTAHLTAPLLGVLYGRVLTLKLAFVTLAVLLGGYNRMIYLPRLQHTVADSGPAYRDAQRSFDRLLAVEAVAMVAVLAVAGVLGHTSPSGG